MQDYMMIKTSERKFMDLHLCYCGYENCSSMQSYGPAMRPNYVIHYILCGKGKYQVEDRVWELSAGQGFLIEPDTQVFYEADKEDPWSFVWMGFDGIGAKAHLRSLGLNSEQLTFQCDQADQLKKAVTTMLENNSFSTANEFLWESQLYSFFAVLADGIKPVASKQLCKDNMYVTRGIEYIKNHYSYPIHVTDVADYVKINRSYLSTLFQRFLGVSPQEYLMNFRLDRAGELLVTTTMSIDAIAKSCGYIDSLVFSKAFKKKMGFTPTQYRKNYKEIH